MNYVYILRCADGSLYTGWTNNLARRLKAHSNGSGAKYTRSRLPVKLVYYEKYEDINQAKRREIAIKRFSKKKKEALLLSAAEYAQDNASGLAAGIITED